MTTLSGEFQTGLSLPDALDACAEAIDGLGWHIETIEGKRIVSYADSGAENPPRIEVVLNDSGSATDLRIIGTDSDLNPLQEEELIAVLNRARNAIQASTEDAEQEAEPEPPGPPAGWYSESQDGGQLRYWDGQSWTDQVRPAEESPPSPPAVRSEPVASTTVQHEARASTQPSKKRRGFPRPHWRKMTWVLIIWTALILLWAITGAAGNECASETTELNRDACEAGTGIGVALILFVGFFGFAFFSLIWFMTRPKGRECPACGERVKKGHTVCPDCGYDFAGAATVAAAR